MRDDYKRVIPHTVVDSCPVCGSLGEVWRYSESDDSPTTVVVMCSNGEKFGPQDGLVNEGCLLYMPPDDFYRPRMADAITYWNAYAKALIHQRQLNSSVWRMPPAPVRKTDEHGNFVNREEFKHDAGVFIDALQNLANTLSGKS